MRRRKQKLHLLHGVNSKRAGDWHEHIKGTYVCFKCRTAKKASRSYGFPDYEKRPECPCCKGDMRGIGTTWRIPIKSNVGAWKRMELLFQFPPTKKSREILKRDRPDGVINKRPPGVRRQRFF